MEIDSKQFFEDHYPTAAMLAGAAYGWYFMPGESLEKILEPSIGIASMAVGFLITAQSLIFSLQDSPLIKWMKETAHFRRVAVFFSEATVVSFGLAAVSTIMFIADLNLLIGGEQFYVAIWTGLAAYTCALCLRVILVYNKITKYLASKNAN